MYKERVAPPTGAQARETLFSRESVVLQTQL
jgi:hypothetical protein